MVSTRVPCALLIVAGALAPVPGGASVDSAMPGRGASQEWARPAVAASLYAFGRNVGQAPAGWSHVAHGAGFTHLLAPAESAFRFAGGTVRLRFVGAAPGAACRDIGALPARAAYLGPGRAGPALRDIPLSSQVVIDDIYEGVTLRWRDSRRGTPEYDVILAPGADASAITLRMEGGASRIDGDGALVTTTAAGAVRQSQPVAWQATADGPVPVGARFAARADGAFGFVLGAHDATREVVIDPEFEFSTYLGGGQADRIDAIALDPSGSTYVLGTTWSPDLPTVPASPRAETSAASDVFVSKFSPDGSTLLWSVYVGGSRLEYPGGLAVDSAGRVTAACRTQSADFPVVNAAFPEASNGGPNDTHVDTAVFRLAADGQSFEFSTFLGGLGDDVPTGVGLLPSGEAVVGGFTDSTDFPVRAAIQATYGGGATDAFVTRFGPTGALVSSTYLGGVASDLAECLAVGPDGSVALGGVAFTAPGAAPFVAGTVTDGPLGGGDAFVAVIAPSNASLTFSRVFGGRLYDSVAAVAIDSAGSICAAGGAGSRDFPLHRPIAVRQRTSGGISGSAWAGKFAPDGSPQWVTLYEARRSSFGATAMSVDVRDGVWLGGTVSRFTPTGQVSAISAVRLAADGTRVTRCVTLKEAKTLLNVYGATAASDGGLLLAGDVGANILPGPAAFQRSHAGRGDGFLARLGGPVLGVRRARVRLDFAESGNDRVRLVGRCELASVPAEGTDVDVDFGGVVRRFRMGRRGRAREGADSFRLSVRGTSARFTLSLAGDLTPALRDEGLTDDSRVRNVARDVRFALDDREEPSTTSVPLSYTADPGGRGRAKLRRE